MSCELFTEVRGGGECQVRRGWDDRNEISGAKTLEGPLPT